MEMGERIHQKRVENNMTMEELATRLGVQKSAVNKWEKGYVKNIRRDTIQKMAEIFDCNPLWIMGWDNVVYDVKDSDDAVSRLVIEPLKDEKKDFVQRATAFYEAYQKAPQNVQDAVKSLLKDVPPES